MCCGTYISFPNSDGDRSPIRCWRLFIFQKEELNECRLTGQDGGRRQTGQKGAEKLNSCYFKEGQGRPIPWWKSRRRRQTWGLLDVLGCQPDTGNSRPQFQGCGAGKGGEGGEATEPSHSVTTFTAFYPGPWRNCLAKKCVVSHYFNW